MKPLRVLPSAATLFEKLPRALRRHRLMTAWMRLTGENPLQLVRIRDQAFGYADLNNGFLRLIVIERGFEADFFRVADSLLSQGGTFLDVGANHGLLSFGLAPRHSATTAFHLFEPNPLVVASIRESLDLHPTMRCRVNAVAVSDKAGVVRLLINPDHTGTSHVAEDGGVAVPSITLDDYLDDHGIQTVALVKMDVEGHELVALRGAARSLAAHRCQAIYFEYFEKNLARVQPPAALIAFLDAAGYEVCFCRAADLEPLGRPSHSLRAGLPGHGLGLVPVAGHTVPPMTDLLAIPRENLARLS